MSGGKKLHSIRKRPLAAMLAERGIFDSEDEARRWVMSGKVFVNGQRVDKPGMLVPGDAVLNVHDRRRYASRGGYKLEAALAHFHVTAAGRAVLDSGASTGGFTDCLLQHGATLVYAVEVGYGQLVGRLRADPRVRNLERTNLSDLAPAELNPLPTLITLDLSYLSLTKALPIAAHLLGPEGEVLALLKPLFEVDSATARRTGHIDDSTLLIAALRQVLQAGVEADLVPLGATKLALRPRHGVAEFFVYFVRSTSHPSWDYNDTTLAEIIAGPGIGSAKED